jgi:hypothetical protein
MQGCLFGMKQSQAIQWFHLLLPTLLAARRVRGATPARSLTALAQRRGVTEADAAPVITPREEASAPVVTGPAAEPASPVCPCWDGTAHRPPQDPPAQTACERGKTKDHPVKNDLLLKALLIILFLRATHGGRVPDKRMAETTPSPVPAGAASYRIWSSWRVRSRKWPS